MNDAITDTNTKLKVLRISRNWSQEYVAEKIDVTQAAYSKLEAGQTRLTIDRAEKLASLYEIDPEYFFTNDSKIVHYYNGNFSHSKSIINPQTYTDNYVDTQKEFYERMIKERDDRIKSLEQDLDKTRDQLSQLIEKLANKL